MKQDRIKERLLKMYRLATDGVDGLYLCDKGFEDEDFYRYIVVY